MSLKFSSDRIKAEALDLGFSVCGISKACEVEDAHKEAFSHWIAEGKHAEMEYMAHYGDKRFDPRALVEGAKSIVCVALNYSPARRLPEGEYQIADYALGKDYHDVMKAKLHALAQRLQLADYRAFCDTAPVLERYWAWRSGIGFIGRNHLLIVPNMGSRFFLGELVIQEEADCYDSPCRTHCGTCRRCLDACPTCAIQDGKPFDAVRCLSYQLIENRGELSELAKERMGNSIYGCDRCQRACPFNRFAVPTPIGELQASEALLRMMRADWHSLDVEQYRALFKGSAVKRAKYEGLMRNIRVHRP